MCCMSATARAVDHSAGRLEGHPTPTATRLSARRWRDPRVVVGVGLVALSVLLGTTLLGAADDTVAVWRVRSDLRQGQPLTAHDVTRTELSFADAASARRYVSADAAVPSGSVLGRDVGAGELLPRAAVVGGAQPSLTEVPLSVAADAVPATVRAGSVVDVWVTPDAAPVAADRRAAEVSVRVFDDVAVVSTPRSGTSLGPSATRQVIVGVTREQEAALPRALAALARGAVVLTRQG
jgi:hypothetical protein